MADSKPVLTLFTHDHCQLCEELVHELQPFEHRFKLERVNILEKENIKYLRLYRYDIPVLMLNGQFLSMHRLDKELLVKRLKEMEELQKNER